MDPALWELLRAEAVTDGTGIIEAIIRFARPGIEIPDVRIVSRFGAIATCRIRARDVIAVRARPDVVSLKAARGLSPGFESAQPEIPGPAQPGIRPTDIRRSPTLTLTGAGVVVASADWGVDVDSAAFRWPAVPATADADRGPGGTRFLSFWDQRDQAAGPRPDPYGYGTVHDGDEIDRALQGPRPYELLGYHPAIADPAGLGTHGTHVLDIAAGNGRAGGPTGLAPDADLIFVHLADRNTGGLANFGDSVRLLEAVDFISATAGAQPCVINISAGRICGPKDGTTLVERAFDELLSATPGRFIVNSAGNYFRRHAHARGTIAPGEARSLSFVVDPADITLNELEIWYDGADEFAVRVDPPGHAANRAICLGERSDLLAEGRLIGRVYHRKHDPNNGDNHIVAFIDPIGHAGNWTVTLEARRVSSGRFHAWIERDDSCPGCQARFTRADSNSATTIGSITTSHLPLIVGAYNGHDPGRPAAPFSSRGPSRDLRPKPDLAAPGVAVLAARSAPIIASRSPGLLTRKSGTSMATPHVTGAVALCLQAAGTRLSAHQIRSLVLGSCDPAPDSDPCRLGRGYLNIPRLIAGVQQALAAPASTRGAKEPTMDTEDIIALLAAAPATAYREYLYRPHGQFARWIGDRFEVVAKPGQRIGRAPQAGDVLLQVRLGRIHLGRCIVLGDRDHRLAATPPKLAPGQLLLRPRRRAALTEPLPVEPAAEIPYLALSPAAEPWAAWPAGDPTEAITPVTTLTSPRFAGDTDLDAVAKGTLRLAAPGTSPYPAPVLSQGPAIAKIQQALIDLSYPLPQHGADGRFGAETGAAVTKYKTDRSITPNDPVIGRLTIASLDTDIIAHDQPTPPPPTPAPAPAPPPPLPSPPPPQTRDLADLERRYLPSPPAKDAAPHTRLGDAHPIIDGSDYFAALLSEIRSLQAGDLWYWSGWLTHADHPLDGPRGTATLGTVALEAVERGVDVRGLIWTNKTLIDHRGDIRDPGLLAPLLSGMGMGPGQRSLLETYIRLCEDNIRNAEALRALPGHAGGQPLAQRILIDWSGDRASSHHMKAHVFQHGDQLTAYCGGIDLVQNRWDSRDHPPLGGLVHDTDALGHPRVRPAAPGWHDLAVKLTGEAAAQVLRALQTRWFEASTLSDGDQEVTPPARPYNPRPRLANRQITYAQPPASPSTSIQVVRSVPAVKEYNLILPNRHWDSLPADGVHETKLTFTQALAAAQRYIYIEDQSFDATTTLFPLLRAALGRGVKVIALTVGSNDPGDPGAQVLTNCQLFSNSLALLSGLPPAAQDNFALWRLAWVVVHSKLVIIDDEYYSVGSANFMDRSMQSTSAGDDSEITACVVSTGSAVSDLRTDIWCLHLGITDPAQRLEVADLDRSLGFWRPGKGWGRGFSFPLAPDPACAATTTLNPCKAQFVGPAASIPPPPSFPPQHALSLLGPGGLGAYHGIPTVESSIAERKINELV